MTFRFHVGKEKWRQRREQNKLMSHNNAHKLRKRHRKELLSVFCNFILGITWYWVTSLGVQGVLIVVSHALCDVLVLT